AVSASIAPTGAQGVSSLTAQCSMGYKSWRKKEGDVRAGYGAFAASPNGHCGWSGAWASQQQARSVALSECRKSARGCTIIAETKPTPSMEPSNEIKTWTKEGMLAGATSTEAECVRPDRVWVTDKGNGYCIRYFKNDVEPKAGIAVVIFQGDYVAIGWKDGKRVKPYYTVNYDGKVAFRVTRELTTRSKNNLMIFVSRPGTLGSSGDHKQKFKHAESRVINSALDQIKERQGLSGFVLVGHSGGALLVANLLAKRSDIKCAVMDSGAHDVYRYAEDAGFDSAVWALWENPVLSIANLKPSS